MAGGYRGPGGRSPALVLKICAVSPDGRDAQPFVVKIGRKDRITQEISGTQHAIEDYVRFRNRAQLIERRCVTGARDRFLVTHLVDKATLLCDYLAHREAGLAIAALFGSALSPQLADVVQAHVRLQDQYSTCIPTRRQDLLSFHESAGEAATLEPGICQPEELLARLKDLPAVNVFMLFAHGDLHARNVFVTDDGSDVVLIDFAQVTPGIRTHAAADLAALEVSLAFDGEANQLPDAATLLDFYVPGLLVPRAYLRVAITGAAGNRLEAMKDIRLHARSCCGTDYDVAVAFHLLEITKYDTFPLDRRALAYRILTRLAAHASPA